MKLPMLYAFGQHAMLPRGHVFDIMERALQASLASIPFGLSRGTPKPACS
jgi:hypothetical protein